MRVTIVFLGLLLALAVGTTATESRGQVMVKKDKTQVPQKSQFFALFSFPVDPQIAEDEQLLQESKIAVDGRSLLKFLVSRIPTEKDLARLEPLVKKLSDKSFKIREQAAKDLVAAGPLALPLLRPLQSKDLETSQRAEKIIKTIEQRFTSGQTAGAVRLLRERKISGSIPLLLEFLPHAANDIVEDELVMTVLVLTIDQKKIDPALAAALMDPLPLRRSLAALVLGREGSALQRAEVRKLLSDKDASVRFRAAQGLLCARDKSGVAVLVAQLADSPFRYAEQAEDLLQRLAGDKAPQGALADNKAARTKSHEAWKKWWQTEEARFDLAKSDTDLFFSNTQQRCKEVSRQFFNSILKTNFAMFQKSTDVPFNFVGQITFSTRDELDSFFKTVFEGMKDQIQKQNLTFKVGKVVTTEEYAKKAPQREQDYLLKLPSSQTRIVHASVLEGGRDQSFGIIIRVIGPRVRVIGISQPTPN